MVWPPSLLQFDTVRDIKEKLCYIPTCHDKTASEDEYELPDGSTVTLDKECRSKAAEVRSRRIKYAIRTIACAQLGVFTFEKY